MAPNEHLLDNFSSSTDTRALGARILRLAQAKTGPGSGRELRELRVGLPAASILIACERLNNTEVNTKAAQAASCLKDRDFRKVYETVRTILDENERANNITYDNLHAHYNRSSKLALPSDEPTEVLQGSPIRRSSRTTSSAYGTNRSPTKSPLPPPWKKGLIRELPSKDRLRKHSTEAKQTDDALDEPSQTPSKRRRIHPTGSDSSAFHAALGDGPSAVHSPSKSPVVVKISNSPLKRSHALATSATSESDESEQEALDLRGRFRPVYIEQRQWTAQDPLVTSIWKRAEKLKAQQKRRKAIV